MLRGIYSAASGMASQMFLSDITAHNIANINTPGFKGVGTDFKTFGDVIVERINNNEQVPLGEYALGSQVHRSITNFTQGDVQQTGNPLDLALRGDGFFVVKVSDMPERVLYTRGGNFTQDAEGFIVSQSGGKVQGESGDILIPRGTKKIEINNRGDVMADGRIIERLKIAQFQNSQTLKRLDATTYQATAEPLKFDSRPVSVEQGYLEKSNANVITELMNSMTGLRAYEILQRSVQMQNETLGKAVNDVGRTL